MPGFPLAALGAGLGQWAQYAQQQAAQRERQQMLMLQLQNYQQQMQDRQRDRQGQDELGKLDLSGPGTSIAPVNPTGGLGQGTGIPMARAAPAALGFDAARNQPPPVGTPMPGGPQSPPSPPAGFGAIGTGQPMPSQPPPLQINLAALDRVPSGGSFTPMRTPPAMAGGNPGVAGTGEPPPESGGTQVADASRPSAGAAAPQAAPQGGLAAEIAKIPMPSIPNLDINGIAQRIQQQAPHAKWEDRQKMLRDYIAERNPEVARQWDRAWKDYENQRSVVIEQWKERHSDAEWRQRYGIERKDKLADRDATGGTITTGPGGEAFNVQGAGARPIIRSDTGEPLVKEGAKKSPSNITVTGADGKEIFKGSAHPDPNAKEGESSWIDDRTQKRIEIPDDANLTILGRGGEGRQAAAQMVRLTSGANEARRQIANVARMSNRATTSWFQGLQSEQGHNLTAGLQRTLANAITPDQEQIMSTLGRGIGRSLATLETAGAATGLVALQNSMQQVMPAKGDKVSTVLLKIGEMRQIAEQGIESALASPAVGAKQADLLKGVQDDLRKAVPWTVPDVIDMIQAPGAETYQSFAAKIGLGKKGATAPAGDAPAAGAAAGPKEGDIATAPGKPDLVFRGGAWVPQ